MALHPEFPKSPYAELLPDQRWFPAAEELRSTAYEKLLARLRQWCEDATSASQAEGGTAYRFVYVDQQGYERNPPKNFAGLAASLTEHQKA